MHGRLRLLHRSRLHAAAANNDIEELTTLIEKENADINAIDEIGYTPLMHALPNMDAVYQLLTNFKADPNCRKANQRNTKTALHIAAQHGYTESIIALLKQGGDPLLLAKADTDPICDDMISCLHIAIREGHVSCVEAILKHQQSICGDPIHQMTPHGWRALHFAAWTNIVEICQILFDSLPSLRLRSKTNEGRTPSDIAHARDNQQVVQWLFERQKALRHEHASKKAAERELRRAINTQDADLAIQILQERPELVYSQDRSGNSILVLSISQRQTKVSHAILSNHPDVKMLNMQDNMRGWTALHHAVFYNDEDIGQKLLTAGADPTIACFSGETPCDIAQRFRRINMFAQLRAAALAQQRATSNQSPLTIGLASGPTHFSIKRRSNMSQTIRNHKASLRPAPVAELLVKPDLRNLLYSLQCQEYIEPLAKEGFRDIPSFACIKEADLERLHVRTGQRRLLVRAAAAAATRVPELYIADNTHPMENKHSKSETLASHMDPTFIRPSRAFELDMTELKFVSIVGEGSFGVVHHARWRNMDVAVKSLKVNSSAGSFARMSNTSITTTNVGEDFNTVQARLHTMALEETIGELQHEADMMSQVCNHANVVQFVGVVLRPQPAVVTRFCHLGSAEDVLVTQGVRNQRHTIDDATLLRIAIGAAAGLAHLHQCGIIHRDVAARNILIEDLRSWHVRVADFGFSRVKAANQSKGYTQSSMGPIKWMSPEALRKREYNEQSDVFAFGVTLYEIFVGKEPWAGQENFDVLVRVCNGERMTLPSTLCEDIQALISQCWQNDPKLRPTMQTVYDGLTKIYQDKYVAKPAPIVANELHQQNSQSARVLSNRYGEIEMQYGALYEQSNDGLPVDTNYPTQSNLYEDIPTDQNQQHVEGRYSYIPTNTPLNHNHMNMEPYANIQEMGPSQLRSYVSFGDVKITKSEVK